MQVRRRTALGCGTDYADLLARGHAIALGDPFVNASGVDVSVHRRDALREAPAGQGETGSLRRSVLNHNHTAPGRPGFVRETDHAVGDREDRLARVVVPVAPVPVLAQVQPVLKIRVRLLEVLIDPPLPGLLTGQPNETDRVSLPGTCYEGVAVSAGSNCTTTLFDCNIGM